MLALCVFAENISGAIPRAAIEEKIQEQARTMKKPMGKLWKTSYKRALIKLLAEDSFHSSPDGGETVVISAGGRAKYVPVSLIYTVSFSEEGSNG